MTLVLPFWPRDVPIQVRTSARSSAGPTVASVVSAASTAVGGASFFAAAVVTASAAGGVSAQYPFRERTCTPGRLTLTEIAWNLPSVFACGEV